MGNSVCWWQAAHLCQLAEQVQVLVIAVVIIVIIGRGGWCLGGRGRDGGSRGRSRGRLGSGAGCTLDGNALALAWEAARTAPKQPSYPS